MSEKTRVGLAFQGGCFLSGAIATGVVHALVDRKAFDKNNIIAFSGTSAGALVAAMCWGHMLRNNVANLPEDLRRQWLHNANGLIPTERSGSFWKLFDRWMSLINPVYFAWKDAYLVPVRHEEFEEWLTKCVEPEECMKAIFDAYIGPSIEAADAAWLDEARKQYYDEKVLDRPRLAVGTAEIHTGEVVTINDEDLFEALLNAFGNAMGANAIADRDSVAIARATAVKVGTEYMIKALMTSGSLDTINGMTEIDDIRGLSNEKQLHKGHYLDGAYSQNPPVSALTNFDVEEIWEVEVFPKRCDAELDSNERREDRKEELLQNAPLEHQYQFINTVNFWVASGQLKPVVDAEQNWSDPSWKAAVIKAYKRITPHADRYDEDEIEKKIRGKLAQTYKKIETYTIALPPHLQRLTDGARIVNSPAFLTDKMKVGYENTLRFLDTVH